MSPLTNDYDEAIVSGRVSRDHWVVDKVTRAIVEAKPGAKQLEVVLAEGGGVREAAHERRQALSLTDTHVAGGQRAHRAARGAVRRPGGRRMGVCRRVLHALQARPITTYERLAEAMMAPTGEPRRLYSYGGLSNGFTLASGNDFVFAFPDGESGIVFSAAAPKELGVRPSSRLRSLGARRLSSTFGG